MAQARSARAINREGKNSVRNLRYGPRTRLVRGISSAIADHTTQTGHRIKCDHFDLLATGQSDIQYLKLNYVKNIYI